MNVGKQRIREGVRDLGLSQKAVCLHSSLNSFGRVTGGAGAVVQAFLDEGCTILVPTFSGRYAIAPPVHLRFERNGWNYETAVTSGEIIEPFSPAADEIDREMGAIPAAVLSLPGRVRGNNPLDSFTAAGPLARELAAGQTTSDVYAPLEALARVRGFVLLMGVGLERMTLLHLAEKEAGRTLFRRWAKDTQGRPIAVEVGGCSEGFGKLEPYLSPDARTTTVGRSCWTLFPADAALARAAAAIRTDTNITHCGVETCERCNDSAAGGAIVDGRPQHS